MASKEERLIETSKTYLQKHDKNEVLEFLASLFGLAANENDVTKMVTDGLWEDCKLVINSLIDRDGMSVDDAVRFWEISVAAHRFDGVGGDKYLSIPYDQYLKTPHWAAVRAYALYRAGYRCQLCNAPEPLDTHHRTYERRGGEEYRDVIAICRKCHSKFHDKE